MSMTLTKLMTASLREIEIIRRQPEAYSRPALTDTELEEFRQYLETLYTNGVQPAFAHRIYMKAA